MCTFTVQTQVLPLRTPCFSALKGPICIRPLQEASSSITVSVNIVSSHFPIGSLVLRFTAFMFSDLCTHRPSPGFALWHLPAITHKTNFNITCSQHIKMPQLEEIFLSLFSLSFVTPSGFEVIMVCVFLSFLFFFFFGSCFATAFINARVFHFI